MDEKEIDKIAEKIEQRLIQRIYIELGKGVMKKLFWLAIVSILSVAIYFGIIHLPGTGK